MDLPKPPEDIELKNIIDKLAQFVARNGLEFEQMTKHKQKDNPKFSFLFGGEYFNYYQYRVTTEQAILRQKQKMEPQMNNNMNPGYSQNPRPYNYPQPPGSMVTGNNVNHPINQINSDVHFGGPVNVSGLPGPPPHQQQGGTPLDAGRNIFNQKVHEIQEQIRESERNLIAQHQVLIKQQQLLIDETIRKAQDDELRQMAQDFSINLHEFESVLQPIAEACTKDSISMGKRWIFSRCQSPVQYDIIAKFLYKKITTPGQAFETKLHLLYLINDLLNHCYRKGPEHLRRSIESVIIPIYCGTFMESDEEKQERLIKLFKLWENNQYIDPAISEQLNKPQIALVNYQTALCNDYAGLLNPITAGTMTKYNQLQKQHNEFVAHQTAKIHQMQQQQQQIASNMAVTAPTQSIPPSSQPMMQPIPSYSHQPTTMSSNMPHYSPSVSQPQIAPPSPAGQPPPLPMHLQQNHQCHQMIPQGIPTNANPLPFPPNQTLPPGPISTSTIQPTSVPNPQFFSNIPPSAGGPPPPLNPQASLPPPLPPQSLPKPPIIPPEVAQPEVPYYELPAGLMVPLVKLEDFEYRPLDPEKIRLPPPAPPSERLLKAVEAFYLPPSHDRPRNGEGWEQLSLYEFFRAKSQAKSADKKADTHGSYSSDNDGDESPLPHHDHDDRYRKHSDKSTSRSPKRRYREERSPRRRSRHRDSSRSSDSRSPSPRRAPFRSESRTRSRSRHKSPARSLSPPSFISYNKSEDMRLDGSNKGHQMLKKMGWSESTGLGAAGQGIHEPVNPRDVRTRSDYKGIGNSSDPGDPYEMYRKNKGQAFMHRVMKGRSDK